MLNTYHLSSLANRWRSSDASDDSIVPDTFSHHSNANRLLEKQSISWSWDSCANKNSSPYHRCRQYCDSKAGPASRPSHPLHHVHHGHASHDYCGHAQNYFPKKYSVDLHLRHLENSPTTDCGAAAARQGLRVDCANDFGLRGQL